MTNDEDSFNKYSKNISIFKDRVNRWNKKYAGVKSVYNSNLDIFQDIEALKKVEYILVADNPGIEEEKYNKYLIGRAGKSARKFFNDYLNIDYSDFDKKVICLNKTCISTKMTSDLENNKKISHK